MKSYISTGLFLTLLASCGNPHISSTRGGLEQSRPPLTYQEEEECSETNHSQFSFSETEFAELAKCKTLSRDVFTSYDSGPTMVISSSIGSGYELVHRIERERFEDKLLFLGDIFHRDTFSMNVESPVNNEGLTGADHGIDSGSVDNESKDALVWSFSTPVSSWGAKLVGMGPGARVRLFDCSEALRQEIQFSRTAFIGYISTEANICHVSLSAGNVSESAAVDEVVYSE